VRVRVVLDMVVYGLDAKRAAGFAISPSDQRCVKLNFTIAHGINHSVSILTVIADIQSRSEYISE